MNSRFQLDQWEPMTLDSFWLIINAVRQAAADDAENDRERTNGFVEVDMVVARLKDEMLHLSTTEMCQFFERAVQLEATDIGAAYGILGYHELFGYQYTVAWLIYQGRTTFESVTGNPEPAMRALAATDWVPGEISQVSILTSLAYEDRTGMSLL